MQVPSKGKAWVGTSCVACPQQYAEFSSEPTNGGYSDDSLLRVGLRSSCESCSHRPHITTTANRLAEHIARANTQSEHSWHLLASSRHRSEHSSMCQQIPTSRKPQICCAGCLMLTSQPPLPSLRWDLAKISSFKGKI